MFQTLKKKVLKYAFSGGQDRAEDHRRLGGTPEKDISYQYLRYFEEDDAKLQEIYDNFKSGRLLW